ncbi:MAG: UDP-N-acetylmuramoyl-L-alanyl-D-glutamate--2,6-diaminopimelate ligase [Candidatus Marinimicrobia bacterium]|jgi:UDP-N-acetylmuramoyl-L-alanyl-D-glutamate--2,6-diaminopimelate ligase|nr:UDP-N-acetylmuramoyl-L-alanyl-D-glutamate--2,6-diaminopimelate ligase [Candidatus Neomarinimicrobiota bacterium]MBT3501528.1 UDP-N-acetylmuramoyl-L-alanyl-D-glutamate--2,6-diaminopimelate ligase [Candidatus Neomarinimicrobiota bacterium]MBT3840206.1 UDP-N-acetylmuramoyl-L-alanyl-D-glutamate--2,6-diaminopimelate ligase [Candidatus Neomarinimicrobiota bacterium]MBT3999874.1 UDP-N-acetylmuramoyl-L-alanyl-D-glutamate--2,6-diaminopimelate ligase [Candidatus Neomarinimicrobiota bacterium]MBT428292
MTKSLHTIAHTLFQPSQEIPDISISGIKLNSSQVKKGDLFIAISGTKLDGHDFIQDAIDSGANAVISNGRDVGELSVPQIKVANPRRATSIVSAEYYGHPTKDLTVIGITGTNGKTTTASIIYSILTQAGIKTAQLGTLGMIADGFEQNATLTTPDAISLQKTFSELRDADFSHIVMEVSSHALDQYRVADVDFNVAVFTNLTPEHLDYHATLESYYQAKAKLFRMLPLESTAIVNGSDSNGLRMAEETNAPTLTFSRSNETSIHYNDLTISISGISGKISAGNFSYTIQSSLMGEFNAENIIAAVSIAHALGVEKNDIEKGVAHCSVIPGRMESYSLSSGATAIIDYAHTPDAYEKVLGTLKEMLDDNSNLFVVFGAGGDRDSTKRPEMARISEIFSSHCFITPDNPRFEDPTQISNEIVSGFTGKTFSIYSSREEGLKQALKRATQNDIVAVLGKGREEYQDILGNKEFYSDLEIIRKYQ